LIWKSSNRPHRHRQTPRLPAKRIGTSRRWHPRNTVSQFLSSGTRQSRVPRLRLLCPMRRFHGASTRRLLTLLKSSRQNSCNIGSALILHTPKSHAPHIQPIRQPLRGVHMTGPDAGNLAWPAGRLPRPASLCGQANHVEGPRFPVYTPLKPGCPAPIERRRFGRAVGITCTVFMAAFRPWSAVATTF